MKNQIISDDYQSYISKHPAKSYQYAEEKKIEDMLMFKKMKSKMYKYPGNHHKDKNLFASIFGKQINSNGQSGKTNHDDSFEDIMADFDNEPLDPFFGSII